MNTVVYKKVYAKRKGLTKDQLNDILIMEIEYYLRTNPGKYFLKYGKAINNDADRSTDFPLYFTDQKPIQ